jgi:CRP-like cAMP-binding protein
MHLAQNLRLFQLPFFDAIPPSLHDLFGSVCDIEEFPENCTVIRQGDPGDSFYIVLAGSLDVFINKTSVEDSKTTTVNLKQLGPGQYFGEVSLVLSTPRTASVLTRARSLLISITRAKFFAFFTFMPEAVSDFELRMGRVRSRGKIGVWGYSYTPQRLGGVGRCM